MAGNVQLHHWFPKKLGGVGGGGGGVLGSIRDI